MRCTRNESEVFPPHIAALIAADGVVEVGAVAHDKGSAGHDGFVQRLAMKQHHMAAAFEHDVVAVVGEGGGVAAGDAADDHVVLAVGDDDKRVVAAGNGQAQLALEFDVDERDVGGPGDDGRAQAEGGANDDADEMRSG